MIGVILFMALGFVVGWAVQHPAAWAVLLIPVVFALGAGGDVSVLAAILGVVLMALAVLGGRWLAQRQSPLEPVKKDPAKAAEASRAENAPGEDDATSDGESRDRGARTPARGERPDEGS